MYLHKWLNKLFLDNKELSDKILILRKKGLYGISINVNNFFEGHIKLNKDGLPITTKENKDYHGFGMKSIKMIVDKYSGDVSIVIKEDIFNLNIFIPIKK